MTAYIAYYRVSTQRQGQSGLGLDAQMETVSRRLPVPPLLSFTEIESGKRSSRPKLQEALAECRRLKATLVVAKLDRLARNVRFLLTIVESSVPVIFCDLPNMDGPVGKFMLTQMAAVAELEAGLISQRTKAALAEAKKRGVVLGSYSKVLSKKNRDAARVFAERMRPIVESAGDVSQATMAEILNEAGVKTAAGGRWHQTTVSRMLRRMAA